METKILQGETLVERVDNYGMGEESVIKKDGFVIFVPYSLKGELVRIRIDHVKKNFAYATLLEVIEPSPYRRKPVCTRFPRCGGCQFLHVEYSEQLKIKKQNIENLLKKVLPDGTHIDDVVPYPKEFGYRNKLSLPFGVTEGKVSLGFYREGTHKVVSTKKCFLNGDWAETLISLVLDYAESEHLTAYTDDNKRGLLRHLVARNLGDGISVTLVINGDTLPKKETLINLLKEKFSDFTLYISINKQDTNVIFGDRLIKLYGADRYGKLCGTTFPVSPYSFVQVNLDIAEKIISRLTEEVIKIGSPVFIDAYSGIGVIGTIIGKSGTQIANIEIIPSAVEDGKKLYKNLNLDVDFYQGDSAKILPTLLKNLNENGQQTFLFLDPPRKGLSKEVIDTVNHEKSKISKIAYLSCNPATLARDLSLLNFQISSVTPYDMFPDTSHVETLVLLSK